MEEVLEILKANSINEGIEASDIADTDEIVFKIIEQKYLESLAYQIAEVAPIGGPTGAVYSIQYNTALNKVEVIKNNVQVEDDAVENTGFTLEAIQDLQAKSQIKSSTFIAKAFAGVSAFNENTKLLAKLDAWAVTDTSDDTGVLTLTDKGNSESIVFEVGQRVAENIIAINSKNYRGLTGFAVLPHSVAAAFLASGSYLIDGSENGLYVGKIGKIKYYINPDPTSVTVYVGIKSPEVGNSSIVMSPYQHQILTAVDPDSGETNVFNVNRYAMTENSLSTPGNEMLRKFTIA